MRKSMGQDHEFVLLFADHNGGQGRHPHTIKEFEEQLIAGSAENAQ